MGVDCSGLTQICYKQCGIWLPRDASQQVLQGNAVDSLDVVKKNDLCFFVSYKEDDPYVGEEQRIPTHVGICIDSGHVVHASGFVRKDRLDKIGVYCEGENRYTHRLVAIRRVTD